LQALVRSFILFHDCIHDSVFTKKSWNYWAGKFASAAVLCDHETWRRGHLQHHAVVGKPEATEDDPNTTIFWTTEDWAKFPWYKKAVLRVARDPIFYFTIMPLIVFMFAGIQHGHIPDLVRPNWVPPTRQLKNGATFAFVYFFGEALLGCVMYGHGYISYCTASGWFAAIWGFLIFHWQHYVSGEVYYGMPRGVYHREMAAILGSTITGFPHWLHDFWLGIGYHHIHHLNARVPCYKLRQCHEEANPELWRCVPYVGLRRALLSLLVVQYNPTTGRHESFPSYQWIINMFDEEPLVMSIPQDTSAAETAEPTEGEAEGTPARVSPTPAPDAPSSDDAGLTRRMSNDARSKYIRYSALRDEYIKGSAPSWKADVNSGNKGVHGISMSHQIQVHAF
jgi:omega-6 fatty acid desaturase (delta-12 desaturase)